MGGFKCKASHSKAKKKKKKKEKLQDLQRKRSKLERETTKQAFVLSLCSHPQSRVLISYCFRPKQRQRRRRSKQMTIKLSNKHHPAMFPNADCGRARRESESGGSRIVSRHFDAELKTPAKREREKESKVYHERRSEEKEKRETEVVQKHANTVFPTCTRLCFISGPADNLY